MPTYNITEGREKFEDLVQIGLGKDRNGGYNRNPNSIVHNVHCFDPSVTADRTAQLKTGLVKRGKRLYRFVSSPFRKKIFYFL